MPKKAAHLTPAQKIDLKNVAIFDHYINRGEFDFEDLSKESEALVGQLVPAATLSRLARDESWLRDAKQTEAAISAQTMRHNQQMAARSRSEMVRESLEAASLTKQAALTQLDLMTQALGELMKAVRAADDPDATPEERKQARAQAHNLLPGDYREISSLIKDAYGMISTSHDAEIALSQELEALKSDGSMTSTSTIVDTFSKLSTERLTKLLRAVELLAIGPEEAESEEEDQEAFNLHLEEDDE